MSDPDEGASVFCDLFFTLGVPFETAEDLSRTVQFQKQIRRRFSNVRGIRTFTIEMEPGSPWHLDPNAFGVKTSLQRFTDFYQYHSGKESAFLLWEDLSLSSLPLPSSGGALPQTVLSFGFPPAPNGSDSSSRSHRRSRFCLSQSDSTSRPPNATR
jgi:hypothetical protein